MVQSLWEDVPPRFAGEEESTSTWHRTSAGGTRRIRSSASSPRATNCWRPARNWARCAGTSEIAESTWHRWLAQYGGMKANEAKRLKNRSRERPAQEAGRQSGPRHRHAQGDLGGKIRPRSKRSAVTALRERFGVSERRACTVVGLHRSTMRLQPPQVTTEEAELRAWLRKFSTDRPRWGWRRAAKMARRAGWQVNNKRIRRLWRDEGLRVPQRRRKKRLTGIGVAVG